MVSSEALIFVRNLQNRKRRGKYARTTHYARMHHVLPAGKEYFGTGPILSGDPKWLFTVQREGRKLFSKKMRGHIQKFMAEGKSEPIESWIPNFERRIKRFEQRTMDEPLELAKWGANLGRRIAPKDTKALYSAIAYRTIGKRN